MSNQPANQSPEEILELARRRIASRKQAETQEQRDQALSRVEQERRWRSIFLAVVGVILLTFLFTPETSLAWKMYTVAHGLVAQQHNVFLDGQQLPICARNIGIYSGFLINLVYYIARGRLRAGGLPSWPFIVLLALFIVAMAFDGFNSFFGDVGLSQLYTPMNWLRTVTGMLMGISMTTAILLVFNRALRQDPDYDQPVMNGWRDIASLFALNAALFLAVYSNIGLLYWPLAFISFFGILGELFVVNVMIVSLLMGYSDSITSPRQLARPATYAVFSSIFIVSAFALLRFWAEAQIAATAL